MPLAILGISISSILSVFTKGFTSWIAKGAAAFITALGTALNVTTKVSFGAGFVAEYHLIERFGAELVLPFALVSIISSIANADMSGLLRTAFVKLPIALVLAGIALEVVELALAVTDQMSSALLGGAAGATSQYFTRISSTLTTDAAFNLQSAGFDGLVLALIAAIVSFFLWLELVVRSAAITVATLFVPIALAGVVWPVTAHWARRLGETIAALVASKLVIAAVLALALTSLSTGEGLTSLVNGIGLISLASFAPFALFRLLPFVETHALAGLEGLSRRGMHTGQKTGQGLGGFVGGLWAAEPEAMQAPAIELAEGSPVGGPEFDALVEEYKASFRDRSQYYTDNAIDDRFDVEDDHDD